MDALEKKLRRLVDKWEIQEQLYRWARATARKDWALTRTVFHPDAKDDHGTFDGSVDQFIAWQQKHHSGVSHSVHMIGNTIVDFITDDLAMTESYSLAFHHYTSEESRADIVGPEKARRMKEMTSVLLGRLIDKFERREGVWRISYRSVAFETAKTEEAGRNLLAHWVTSTRDANDPIHKIRADMGLPPMAAWEKA